jgi:hypothetical protein
MHAMHRKLPGAENAGMKISAPNHEKEKDNFYFMHYIMHYRM